MREERLLKQAAMLALCLNMLALEAVLAGEREQYDRVMRLATRGQWRSTRRMQSWMATGRLDKEKEQKARRLIRKLETTE